MDFLQVQAVDISAGWVVATLVAVVATMSGVVSYLFKLQQREAGQESDRMREQLAQMREALAVADTRYRALQEERLAEALAQQQILNDVQQAMQLMAGQASGADVMAQLQRMEGKLDAFFGAKQERGAEPD